MSTLTDRYVWAVARLLPEHQRGDIERELRELIAETVDDRADDAALRSSREVEHEVLAELGDPSAMASRYTDRPRSLVGREVFPEYLRILRLVFAIAVPIVTGMAVLGTVLDDGADAGDVVGAAIGAAFNSGIQVAFWVTLVYAFAERWKADNPWTPDQLPALPAAGTGTSFSLSATIFGIVVTVLTIVAIVWQHAWPSLHDEAGEGVPFLDPGIWNGGGQALLALLVASLVVQVAVLARRGWSYRLAVANAVVNVASVAVVTWLAIDERLLNAEFLTTLADRAGWDDPLDRAAWGLVAVVAIIEVWDTIEAFVAARRGAVAQRSRRTTV